MFRGLVQQGEPKWKAELMSAQDGRADSIHFVFDGDLAAELVTCF
jgi:hypothetical protein